MEQTFLSLLYPDEASVRRHEEGSDRPRIAEDVVEELGLGDVFSLKNGSLCDFFTKDPEVIRYRQATLRDMEAEPALAETLAKVLPI